MKRTAFAGMSCSIAQSLDIIGEWWTPLILRDLLAGLRRFDELQAELGISRNILADRLRTLVDGGVVERQLYATRPDRYEYRLTPAGRELLTVVAAIQEWGDRWVSPSDTPYGIVTHGPDRHSAHIGLICDECGEVPAAEGRLRPGPAYRPGALHTHDERTAR